MLNEAWHTESVDAVLGKLHTSAKGLSKRDAEARLKKYGLNELAERKGISALTLFLRQFKSFLILILVIATVVSFLIGQLTDALIIFLVLMVNAFLGFYQESKAQKAMEALKKLVVPKVKAIRDDNIIEISAKELVPGDVIILSEGDKVPADARVIESINMKVDESSLTGESVPTTKEIQAIHDVSLADRKNMVYMGTAIASGNGKAVVVGTGMQTEFGKIAELIHLEEQDTPLQVKLTEFGKWLGGFVLIVSAIAFFIGILGGQTATTMFLTAAALAVSAVPEGLPAVVTVTLALGMHRMSKENAILRKLSAVEALGSTTVIATDKTGTITTNEMTVRELYANNKFIRVTGVGFDPEGEFLLNNKKIQPKKHNELNSLLMISSLCNNASLSGEEGLHIIGDPTEGALLILAAKGGIWKDEVTKEFPRLAELPFSSERQIMTTVHKISEHSVAYTKGAPEAILERCTHILKDSREEKLTDAEKETIHNAVHEMAKNGLRVLGFAYKQLPDQDFRNKVVETKMVFVGLAGMIDPPRKESKDAIKLCKQAGINVMMLTGDHKTTAIAVAKEIELLEDTKKLVIDGRELDKMNDMELEEIVDNVAVFARVTPQHKDRIVNALRRKGHIVAVTGDGVNDAPALEDAHIGIAMGIKGTEVAKEASDMVLLDDNFATIVKAVEEGRIIYDNLRKYIRYALSGNFSEIFFISIAVLAGLPLPLLPIQILWMNLLTHGIPAVTLSMDVAEKDIMKRKPRNPKESIFKHMLLYIVAAGALGLLSEITAFVYGIYSGYPIERVRAIALTTSVLFTVLLIFNCRSDTKSAWERNPFRNKYLVPAVLASIFLQLLIIYVPQLNAIFGTAYLPLSDLVIAILLGSTALLLAPKYFLA